MDLVINVIVVLVVAGAVFATAYFTVKNFLDNESKKRMSDLRQANQNLVTPIRLQAYERVVLFLERISPNSLVMRTHKNGMSGLLLQSELIKTIRSEYEHNLSQQIYMSNNAWQMVTTAKEEIIKLINISATKVPETATGLELAQMILGITGQIQKLPTQVAVEYIKKEISQNF
jgi:16S rRNA C1402 (ribose-2'-O) methylase RsmI